MTKLTLGTAQIIQSAKGSISLRYMNHGSFLIGEQTFGKDINSALRFCRERGLRVIATTGFAA
jgi:hypothetical protein